MLHCTYFFYLTATSGFFFFFSTALVSGGIITHKTREIFIFSETVKIDHFRDRISDKKI